MGQEDVSKKVDPESYFLKKQKLQAQAKLANKKPLTEAEKQAKKAAKKLKKKEKKLALRAPGSTAQSSASGSSEEAKQVLPLCLI